MKKLMLFLIGMFASTMIMAQTNLTEVSNDISTDSETLNVLPAYDGPCGFINPMPADEFDLLLKYIKSKNTESQMYSLAKISINNKCLFTKQVEEIMLVFMDDLTRTSFLKFARGQSQIYDEANYRTLAMKYPKYGNSTYYGQISNYNNLKKDWLMFRPVNEMNLNWNPTIVASGPQGNK